MRRHAPPPPRLAPFRLHYPTHAGNSGVSSIPPPYEMAFPPPRPQRTTNPLAFVAVMTLTASAVVAGGLYGARQYGNMRAREEQRALVQNERAAETHAVLASIHDRFPVGLTDEQTCEGQRIPEGTRAPLLSFAQLRAGGAASPGEAALQPTSFVVTKDTSLDGPIVAVLMTTEASVATGSYEGWLVLFDRKAAPLCRAHVVAKSETSFADLKNQVRGAERAAGSRLSPNLALEL